MMKKCLSLPLIVLALLTAFIFVGCGAKETPPTPAIAEAPPTQESDESHEEREAVEQKSEEAHSTKHTQHLSLIHI